MNEESEKRGRNLEGGNSTLGAKKSGTFNCSKMLKDNINRRSEPRSTVDQYSSVEFSIDGLAHVYQFKIWNTSLSGMGVLVKEASPILKHLEVGDILELKYYPMQLGGQPEFLKTEIKHITKDDKGQFKGHYMVGLSTLEKLSDHSQWPL